MAAPLAQIQAELEKTLRQVHALSQELSSVNQKVEFLNTDRTKEDNAVDELKQANKQLVKMISSNGGGVSPATPSSSA